MELDSVRGPQAVVGVGVDESHLHQHSKDSGRRSGVGRGDETGAPRSPVVRSTCHPLLVRVEVDDHAAIFRLNDDGLGVHDFNGDFLIHKDARSHRHICEGFFKRQIVSF